MNVSVSEQKTALLTLGRLPAALEVARAFSDAGWRVIVAEPMAWHLCRLSKSVERCYTTEAPTKNLDGYLADLHRVINNEAVDLVVPISEEILYASIIASQVSSSVRVLTMSQPTLITLHDKWRFAHWASINKLAVPETRLVVDANLSSWLSQTEAVLKPRLSCSGVGVKFIKKGSSLEQVDISESHIVQARLAPVACSSFAIAANGQCIELVVYQGTLVSGAVSVSFEQMMCPTQVLEFNQQLVARLQYSGMISFDFMQDDNGHWRAIECNPRATSGIHFIKSHRLFESLLKAAAYACADRNGSEVNAHSFSTNVNQNDTFAAAYAVENTLNAAIAEAHPEPSDELLTMPNVQLTPPSQTPVLQEFWSSLTEVEGQLFKGQFKRQQWQNLFTTPDISWSRNDWKPAMFMPFVMWPILWKAIKGKQPVSQLVMQDVGWYQAPNRSFDVDVNISRELPNDANTLLEKVVFGSDGLRYQRLQVSEQLNRFHDPRYICAYHHSRLIGLYIIDKRELSLHSEPITGFYRGALAVLKDYQGCGVGKQMTIVAMNYLDQFASSHNLPVFSYGCIDRSNSRSLRLLASQSAQLVGQLTMKLLYRQWPKLHQNVHIATTADIDKYRGDLAIQKTQYGWFDQTPQPATRTWVWKEAGEIQIAATVSVTSFRIVDMGAWLKWVCRFTVTPWPAARKRFDPNNFRSVVMNSIVIHAGYEQQWTAFVSAVLAEHQCHFATLYIDSSTPLYTRLFARHSWFKRLITSRTKGNPDVHLMGKWHGASSTSIDPNADEFLQCSNGHESPLDEIAPGNALYPVDS